MIGLREPRRCDLGDEQRDADADRHREEQREDADEERAVDQRPGAELALRRDPSRRRRSRALPPRTTATPSSWSSKTISPRITSTSRPPSSATHRKMWSVTTPGGRRADSRARAARVGIGRRFGGRSDHGHGVSSFSDRCRAARGGLDDRPASSAGWGWRSSASVSSPTDETVIFLTCALRLLEQTLRQRRVVDRRCQLLALGVDVVRGTP